ncbi:RluA family pseudouridine synthase [Croceimicrobium hydrocarbonivorans]|uniref:Pseudouridine synthase n=1 Tax=Croceimicrobium hydrocarbonivorans TaxID=2761580 RepID=A0A7H0VH60_9FLAO|nr:RluA family pseudouridine synthase [Croceimicrobium hydrocarbonivorans]QNR25058.1 RluA family pseudouridine synthase [Croceimicrobium hydrocarbonivorans]
MREEDQAPEEENEELYEHHRIVADAGQKPLRVDKFLGNLLANTSRNKIQQAAAAGNIRVNDLKVKSNYKVKPEDVVQVVLSYPPREVELVPQDIPIPIVYQDKDVIVVHKPPGMVVHPGYGNFDGTLVNALLFQFQNLPGLNQERPGLVHRLDRDTSGTMVIAANEHAMAHLANQFFERTTERTYWAVVWGNVEEDSGTIIGNIGRSPKNRKIYQVYPEGDQGKHAVTHYRVLERLGYVTLVECKLETGRTHQIRVHMKHIGHTLFNDKEYGGDKILKGTTFTKYKQFVENCFTICPRQALHAKTLGFEHPKSGERLSFDSELPDDMKALVEKWRNYSHFKGQ